MGTALLGGESGEFDANGGGGESSGVKRLGEGRVSGH